MAQNIPLPKLALRGVILYHFKHCTFGVSHVTIINHLHRVGKISKLGKWVPHELTEANKQARVTACQSLLGRCRRFHWLESVITMDEKWVLYSNVKRRRSWCSKGQQPKPSPKGPLVQKKVMISVWWDCRGGGVIMLDLLPCNTTINKDVYCEQIDRLKIALAEKHSNLKKIIYHHDNAPAHRAKKTSDKLKEAGWEIMVHPPYSPDLAPSDYHLFTALQRAIGDTEFENEEDVKSFLDNFIVSKPRDFWMKGIKTLPERWQKVIDNEGDYLLG